jgi:hypothetical protein
MNRTRRLWLSCEPAFLREPAACQRPNGLFVLLPWPLAAWLANALEFSGDEIDGLRSRIAGWLHGDHQTTCCATEPVRVKGK